MTPNAETLVETVDRDGNKQPVGTKLKLMSGILETFVERGFVKELKENVKTKQLKVQDAATKEG